jgi:hypothetical protein
VPDNKALRRTFGPKRKEVTGDCRNLRNEELHSLYSSACIVRMTKANNMGWEGHIVLFTTPIASYKGKHEQKGEIKNIL